MNGTNMTLVVLEMPKNISIQKPFFSRRKRLCFA